MAVNVITIYNEVLDQLNMIDSLDGSAIDSYLDKALINRTAYRFKIGSESTYTADIAGDNFDFDSTSPGDGFVYQAYVANNRKWEYWLSPYFDVETDVDYTVNASGSIEITSVTEDSRTSISVSAIPINFALLMAELLQTLADRYARKPGQAVGALSISPQTVRAELIKEKTIWTSESWLYMSR